MQENKAQQNRYHISNNIVYLNKNRQGSQWVMLLFAFIRMVDVIVWFINDKWKNKFE